MEPRIPSEWRQGVCRVLSSCSLANVIVSQRALRDWQAIFPGAFQYEMVEAFLKALSSPAITGRPVNGMKEPGTIYEFLFQHDSKTIYGKVNLMPTGQVVIIYSAHRPLKGEFL